MGIELSVESATKLFARLKVLKSGDVFDHGLLSVTDSNGSNKFIRPVGPVEAMLAKLFIDSSANIHSCLATGFRLRDIEQFGVTDPTALANMTRAQAPSRTLLDYSKDFKARQDDIAKLSAPDFTSFGARTTRNDNIRLMRAKAFVGRGFVFALVAQKERKWSEALTDGSTKLVGSKKRDPPLSKPPSLFGSFSDDQGKTLHGGNKALAGFALQQFLTEANRYMKRAAPCPSGPAEAGLLSALQEPGAREWITQGVIFTNWYKRSDRSPISEYIVIVLHPIELVDSDDQLDDPRNAELVRLMHLMREATCVRTRLVFVPLFPCSSAPLFLPPFAPLLLCLVVPSPYNAAVPKGPGL